jgi:hypothetical protein
LVNSDVPLTALEMSTSRKNEGFQQTMSCLCDGPMNKDEIFVHRTSPEFSPLEKNFEVKSLRIALKAFCFKPVRDVINK